MAKRRKNTIWKSGRRIVTVGDSGDEHVVDLMTTAEVAEALRCSVSSLNKWRCTGSGPEFVYVGSRVRYPRAAVVAYVARTYSSTSQQEAAV
jgi:hypothetical protein